MPIVMKAHAEIIAVRNAMIPRFDCALIGLGSDRRLTNVPSEFPIDAMSCSQGRRGVVERLFGVQSAQNESMSPAIVTKIKTSGKLRRIDAILFDQEMLAPVTREEARRAARSTRAAKY
jgi:hypothetical protein